MEVPGYAFITGGGSGIGRACALLFAELGARGVFVADLDLEAARATAAAAASVASSWKFRAEAIRLDVTDQASTKNAVEYMVKSLFGRIDYCVHCAGTPVRSYNSVATASFLEFQEHLKVYAHGTFLVTSLVSAAMASQEPKPVDDFSPELGVTRGAIVNLSSASSIKTPPNLVQDNAAKHAVQGITKTAAIENAPLGIRVNCLCPTWTQTPMLRKAMQAIPGLNSETASLGIPMGRIGTAKEVAQSAIFLCSSWSSFVTGHALPIDGGMTIF